MPLFHNPPDCTGRWSAEIKDKRVQWRCRLCGVVADESEDTTNAAVIENRMGYYLRKLRWEGQALLDQDRQS